MRLIWLTALLFVITMVSPASSQRTSKRKIACKTAKNSQTCYWTHGRVSYYNGTPAIRLWKIGTKRLLGVYSGPSVDRRGLDNENPEMPANVSDRFTPAKNRIFGDFEVCPLEPKRKGTMQASCIETARNVIVSEF